MREYLCVNGHDRCYGGTSAGPECPYCEIKPRKKKEKLKPVTFQTRYGDSTACPKREAAQCETPMVCKNGCRWNNLPNKKPRTMAGLLFSEQPLGYIKFLTPRIR